MRSWSIEISMLDQSGNEIPANILDKVIYSLHPTFANPMRTIKSPPFRVEEQGWGEFDIPISVHLVGIAGKLGTRNISHDLNFLLEKYVVDHPISIPTNKSQALTKLLLESGPVPGGVDGIASGSGGDSKRKTDDVIGGSKIKKSKNGSSGVSAKGVVDLEKLSNGLTKLSEDDLIVIVQMVTDNRTNDMNIKNDVENGEFSMDLLTLPESLLKSLWDFVKKHTNEA